MKSVRGLVTVNLSSEVRECQFAIKAARGPGYYERVNKSTCFL